MRFSTAKDMRGAFLALRFLPWAFPLNGALLPCDLDLCRRRCYILLTDLLIDQTNSSPSDSFPLSSNPFSTLHSLTLLSLERTCRMTLRPRGWHSQHFRFGCLKEIVWSHKYGIPEIWPGHTLFEAFADPSPSSLTSQNFSIVTPSSTNHPSFPIHPQGTHYCPRIQQRPKSPPRQMNRALLLLFLNQSLLTNHMILGTMDLRICSLTRTGGRRGQLVFSSALRLVL